jgi:hypothetical protein
MRVALTIALKDLRQLWRDRFGLFWVRATINGVVLRRHVFRWDSALLRSLVNQSSSEPDRVRERLNQRPW